MKNRLNLLALICTAILIAFAAQTNAQKNYKGKPWNGNIQQIPGKIQCEFYDVGGQGIAYYDADTVNNGSGRLNPADGTYLNEFRINEPVDISYSGLLRQLRDPETRRGLALTLRMLHVIGSQAASSGNGSQA